MNTENSVPNPQPTRKRRGGQPGNHNALKHGYFAKALDTERQSQIDRLPPAASKVEAEFRLQSMKVNSLLENDPLNVRVMSAAGRRLIKLQRDVALLQHVQTDAKFRQYLSEWLGQYNIMPIFPAATPNNSSVPGEDKK